MQAEEPTQTTQHELTAQTTKDLIELLGDKKLQVQKGALNIILQFTNTVAHRRMFMDAGIIPLLLKYTFKEQLMTICLTNLINLSSDIGQEDLTEAIELQFTKTAEPILLQLKSWKGLEKELSILYLTNISKLGSVSNNVIVGEGDKNGYFVELLLGILEAGPFDKLYHIANILANVTSFKEGREHFVSNKGFLVGRIEKLLFTDIREMRIAILKSLRNCLFQFENEQFADGILEQGKQFIDTFGAYMATLLVKSNYLLTEQKKSLAQKHFLPYIEVMNKTFNPNPSTKAADIAEIQLALQCLLIITNIDFSVKKPQYKKQLFKELIADLGTVELQTEAKDKLDLVSVFFS